jgi:SAM-dependent methyltransferase
MVVQNDRERPKGYIDRAINMLFDRRRYASYDYDIDILEIGCMRARLIHHPDILDYECCNDGHSTFLFARTGWRVVSVDINQDHVDAAKQSCADFSNVKHICMDAIEFARGLISSNPKQKIGLLFLDAWDLDLIDSAQSHLDFYEVVKPALNNDCMILIDDTDLYYDFDKKEFFYSNIPMVGKGRLLIPELCKNGYEIVFHGRQTLLMKE